MKHLNQIDLNLLVYLNVLLQEQNVTQAAKTLCITQPAMSNILKRLRKMFGDPLLVRTSDGMIPTEYAKNLQPQLHKILDSTRALLQKSSDFRPYSHARTFCIMTSDYAEATLVPHLVKAILSEAPNIKLQFLAAGDVSYDDMEQGRIDLALGRFFVGAQTLHSVPIWRDDFSCLLHKDNPCAEYFNLKNYLAALHVWAHKAKVDIGQLRPHLDEKSPVDQALMRQGFRRNIVLYTRHYQMQQLLSANKNLVATLPTRLARLQVGGDVILKKPPFFIDSFELLMSSSPLLHKDPAHKWLRTLVLHVAAQVFARTA